MTSLFRSYCAVVVVLVSMLSAHANGPSKTRPSAQPVRDLIAKKAAVQIALGGMVGHPPKLFCWLMKRFKENQEGGSVLLNRLLLYGPPGNGKSTLAQKFADQTGAIFIARPASSMVEKYVGQGANNVAELFNTARQLKAEKKLKVVIFIDEIDALAAGFSGEFRAEHKAALQQLWIELDQCKHDPDIFVIFATNEFKKLSKTFLDRFGYNTLEIGNPNQSLRKKIIAFYAARVQLLLTPELIERLATDTQDLSNRALEDMIYGIKMAVDLEDNGQFSEKTALDVLATIKKKFKENISEKSEHDEAQEKKLQRVNTLVSIVSGSLSSILNSYYLYVIATGILLGSSFGGSPLAHSA